MNAIDILKPALLLLACALVLTPFVIAVGKTLINHWWYIKVGFYKMILKAFTKEEDEK